MANAQAWKAEAVKDRRSNMALSSVNQPAKKDGAGGSYTWGNAMDGQEYASLGAQFTKVMTAPAVQMAQPVFVSQPMQVQVTDQSAFPPIGVGAPAPKAVWGGGSIPRAIYAAPVQPGCVAPTAVVVQAAEQVTGGTRAGVEFGAQHPRNSFARKPQTALAAIVQMGMGVPQIDWSEAGTTAIARQVIQQTVPGVNTTHRGAYVAATPAPTITTLRQQPASVNTFMTPKSINNNVNLSKPRKQFQQPGRR